LDTKKAQNMNISLKAKFKNVGLS